jgi:hypothetical protein
MTTDNDVLVFGNQYEDSAAQGKVAKQKWKTERKDTNRDLQRFSGSPTLRKGTQPNFAQGYTYLGAYCTGNRYTRSLSKLRIKFCR